jgi:hypothetical protein
MDPNYRASEDHWRLIENWPSLCSEYPHSRCILELRARIEALEAAQQPAPATEESSATAPPAPDDRLRWCPSHGQQPRNAWGCPECVRELRAAAAPPAPAGVQRRYPSPATIAECGGPCDSQGPWACDCGLLDALNPPMPAPAGGLVKRLSHLLAKRFSESRPGTDCTPLAREVVREVVKWLRSDGPGWPFAHLLEREANR